MPEKPDGSRRASDDGVASTAARDPFGIVDTVNRINGSALTVEEFELQRVPLSGTPPTGTEICAVSDPNTWKRDALLFDRLYFPSHLDRRHFGIPAAISFSLKEIDRAFWSEMDLICNPMIDPATIQDIARMMSRTWNCAHRDAIASELCRRGFDFVPTYRSLDDLCHNLSPGRQRACEGVLNNLPIVDDDKVSWEQILAFKADREAVRKYRDLRLWLRHGLEAGSVGQATDLIGQKIDDYRWAIEKHGLETRIGLFSQVFDVKRTSFLAAATGAGGAVAGPVGAALGAGIAIGTQLGVWLYERRLDMGDVARGANREVAILHDIRTTFG